MNIRRKGLAVLAALFIVFDSAWAFAAADGAGLPETAAELTGLLGV